MSALYLTAAALLLSLASAEEFFVQTKTFATTHYHTRPDSNEVIVAGLVTGWTIYGIAIVLSGVLIVTDMVKRNNLYNSNLASAIKRMNELGIDINEANKEYERRLKGITDD